MRRKAFERPALMEDDGALQRFMDDASRTAAWVAPKFRMRGETIEAGKVNAAPLAEACWNSVAGRRACAAHECDDQAGVGSMCFAMPNVRAKLRPTVLGFCPVQENVLCTLCGAKTQCRWASA